MLSIPPLPSRVSAPPLPWIISLAAPPSILSALSPPLTVKIPAAVALSPSTFNCSPESRDVPSTVRGVA
jgi:hypothetical protein